MCIECVLRAIVLRLLHLATILYATGILPARAQIQEPILPGISVEVADIMQFPYTRNQGAEDSRVRENIARINFLREIPDETGRWFVNDLRGSLYTANPRTGAVQTYLNFQDEFSSFIFGPGGLATGLISVTPHPAFATNGKLYTIHTENSSGNPGDVDFIAPGNPGSIGQHAVITEWTASDPGANVFAGDRRELMRIATPRGFLHGPGDVAFNPVSNPGDFDYGLLYIAGGDAGYDAYNKGSPQAQRLDSVFGKILRIDPAGTNGVGGEYGTPTFNPYANDGDSNTLAEIYATGFRNAHRIMWDIETGTSFATDIGQNNIEEINILHPGANYGWNQREGTFVYTGNNVGPLPPNANRDGFTYPVAQYDHADLGGDAAIAGGFVYRGTSIPELRGKFVYGDIVHGRLFYSDVLEMISADDNDAMITAAVHELFLTRNGSPVTLEELVLDAIGETDLPADRHDLRFGQTSDGELYLITKQDGWIRQLVAPDRLELIVDRATGATSLRNPTGLPVAIDAYTIGSASGSLDPSDASWNSLADQGHAGWLESSATAGTLAEENAVIPLSIEAALSQSLGSPYAPVYMSFGQAAVEDLEFEYRTADGLIRSGIVQYIGQDQSNNLALTVDPVSGHAQLKNVSQFGVSIDGYSILSDSHALRPDDGDWNSFADQGISDWLEAAPTDEALSELKATTSLLIESGAIFNLGKIFDPAKSHDLELEFRMRVGQMATTMQGIVIYAALNLPGDYDANGIVDASDYTVWRDSLGQTGSALPADGDGSGEVDAPDYAIWKMHFGETRGHGVVGNSGVENVPEASAFTLGIAALVIGLAERRVCHRRPARKSTSGAGGALRRRSRTFRNIG